MLTISCPHTVFTKAEGPKYMNEKFKQEVLTAFQKETPSAIDIEDDVTLSRYEANLRNLFHHRLNFPIKMFSNCNVIDFGCGTGEVDVVLGKWGAKVKGFDFNEHSILRANHLKKIFDQDDKLFFEVGDVDEYPVRAGYFDLAISLGVIAHVPHQEDMFRRMAEACKPGGFIVIGYVESSGLVQRMLHRAICKINADGDEGEVFKIAQNLFGEHISRSVQFGGRTAKSVINDYLINPHYHGIRVGTLLEWQEKYQLEFYSMTPSIHPPFSVNSPYHPSVIANTKIFRTYSALCELRWIFSQQEDNVVLNDFLGDEQKLESQIDSLLESLDGLLQQFDFSNERIERIETDVHKIEGLLNESLQKACGKILKNYDELTAELLKTIHMLGAKASQGIEFDMEYKPKRLFKGYNGLTTNYIVFHKPIS